MIKKHTLWALAALHFVAPANVLAQTNNSSRTDSLQSQTLNPVVVTGTGTYRRAENSPMAVKVISAKELQNAQVNSLQEALTKLTTNVTTHTNGMGSFVNFGGVSDDYIVILENGKRVSGDDRWNRIGLANVKRIEIYSGAASALYGSDAIAGVINVITDDAQVPVSASSYTKFMNHGRLDQDVNVDFNIGKLSSQTYFTHRQADNWQVNPYQSFMEEDEEVLKLTGRPMSTAFRSNNLGERLEWRVDDKWSVFIRGSYYDYLTNRPSDASYYKQQKTVDAETGENLYNYVEKKAYTYDLHHKSYTYGGGARWSPNKRIHVYLDVYSDNFSSKYSYWQTSKKEAYEETRKRTHYVNETLRGIFRLASWNKLSAGVEMIQESLSSQSDNIDFETTNTYNLFVQDELQIAKGLEGVVGLRYTQNDNYGAALTPNLGLFYRIAGFRFRAGYAGGYRTPTLSQLYATDQAKTAARYTLSNDDLQPEKNRFFNLNVEYSNRWMSVSVSGFHNQIREMINYRTLTQTEVDSDERLSSLRAEGWTTLRQRDNIDRATLRGVNASLKFLLPCGFTLAGGYSFTDSEAETKTLNQTTQQYETTITDVDKSVRHVGNFVASWDKRWKNYRLGLTLNGHFQGRRYSSTYGYAKSCKQWDFITRHSVLLPHFTIEPGLGIENLFNQRDTSTWNSNYSTITPGRSVIASLRIKY